MYNNSLQAGEDNQNLFHIGSCSLHVLHGACGTGHASTRWNLNGFLRAIYRIFKDSPSRRQSFIEITGKNLILND